MWFNIAASSGDEIASKNRASLGHSLDIGINNSLTAALVWACFLVIVVVVFVFFVVATLNLPHFIGNGNRSA